MKSKQLTQNLPAKLLGLSLTVLSALAAGAQTWETVLDYQLVAGKESDGSGIVADAFGKVFSGGIGDDVAGTNHGIVLQTDTTQLANTDPNPINWYFSDDTNPSATQDQSVIWNMGLDANGNVYSIGQLTPNGTSRPYWYVRKSSDSGATWSTVDQSYYGGGHFMDATGFAADDTGNIYVAGWGQDETVVGSGKHTTTQTTIHWLVRKSSNGGQTWNLVDDLTGPAANGVAYVPGAGVFVVGGRFVNNNYPWLVRRSATGEPGTFSTVDSPFANVSSAARAVGGDDQGNVYVSGSMFVITGVVTIKHQTTTNGYYAWITRKSSDGGTTWSTVDSQNLGGYGPVGIGKDAAGNVIVVGGSSGDWIVRTPDLSGVWHTIDDFQLTPGARAIASGATTDAAGHLLVAGSAWDSTGCHWIVRRLANTSP
jgi:hypothetical protein